MRLDGVEEGLVVHDVGISVEPAPCRFEVRGIDCYESIEHEHERHLGLLTYLKMPFEIAPDLMKLLCLAFGEAHVLYALGG